MMMIGGHRAQQQERRGPDVQVELPVSLEDLYNGGSIEVDISKQVVCDHCHGSGARRSEDIQTCPQCHGRGMTITRIQLGPGMVQQVQQPCNQCGGKGKTIRAVCNACGGKRCFVVMSNILLSLKRECVMVKPRYVYKRWVSMYSMLMNPSFRFWNKKLMNILMPSLVTWSLW